MYGMNKIGKVLLLLLLCGTTIGGFLWLPAAEGFKNPDMARMVVFHVPCSIVATIASIVATWYAVLYLAKRQRIDDIKSNGSFSLALVFWVLTTVTGAIFAKVQWGAYWSWDIKQTAILMLLMIYLAYFALRAAVEEPRKQATLAAVYSIFAIIAMPYLTYVLPNSTKFTLHPKGVITKSDGLDPHYMIVLWGGVLGLTLVYVWALRLHVAIEDLRLRVAKAAATRKNETVGFVITETVT
jgi:heme exporter protein C